MATRGINHAFVAVTMTENSKIYEICGICLCFRCGS